VKEPTKIAGRQAREERLRSALRENLKRRKAQRRGRAPGAADEAEPDRPAAKREGGEKDTPGGS
jgi:hypothetical protein